MVKFVATTRRWYRQGKPERCRRKPRLPNNQTIESHGNVALLILILNRQLYLCLFFYAFYLVRH
nr:MAG TPA: hypothetical protein [Caudoviricetes sp.]